jgi:transcriptional regulator with XRE-family HTH domain
MKGSSKIYASGFGAGMARGYRRAMGRTVATKIRNLRTVLGINQTELADRLGVTQASVSRWEKGSMPEADKLTQLAELAGETVRSFIEGTADSNTSSAVLNRFWVRGTVAAGVFAAAYEWPQEEWKNYSGGTHIDVPEGSRFGLEATGDSMNMVYPSGTILDCVSIDAIGELRSGQRVIVERRNVAGEVEATVKEYVVADDGSEWLVPRSSNPSFQAISANQPGEGISEVRVVAVVVGSYRPE